MIIREEANMAITLTMRKRWVMPLGTVRDIG
jgi:hypothetical protein